VVEKLDEGEQAFRDAGLRIDGFVAPAWSMSRAVIPLLAERGYRYAEDHFFTYDPAEHTRKASVVLNYASRSPARLASTVIYCRAVRPLRHLAPVRFAIHPADMRYALLRAETKKTLAWAAQLK